MFFYRMVSAVIRVREREVSSHAYPVSGIIPTDSLVRNLFRYLSMGREAGALRRLVFVGEKRDTVL